jgi:hypothetical protein
MLETAEAPKVIVCSICSKVKSSEEGLVPARKRYQGSHIAKVEAMALEQGAPFFILSGKFGLLAGDDGVRNYDYLLADDGVQELTDKIQAKLYEHKIGVVYFYTKLKPQWELYGKALSTACQAAEVELRICRLDPND